MDLQEVYMCICILGINIEEVELFKVQCTRLMRLSYFLTPVAEETVQ